MKFSNIDDMLEGLKEIDQGNTLTFRKGKILLPIFSVNDLEAAGFVIDVSKDHFFAYPYIMKDGDLYIWNDILPPNKNLILDDENNFLDNAYNFIYNLLLKKSNPQFIFEVLNEDACVELAEKIKNAYETNEAINKILYGTDLYKMINVVSTLQELYTLALERLDIRIIKRLSIDAAKFKPPLKLILEFYNRLFEKHFFDDAIYLSKLTGIEIPKKLVLDAYNKLVNNKFLRDVFYLIENTGVSLPEELIQKVYDVSNIPKSLSIKDLGSIYDYINMINKFSEVTKTKIPERLIQKTYEHIFNLIRKSNLTFLDVYTHYIVRAVEVFGKPSEGLMQELYKDLLNDNRMDLIYDLHRIIKIKPSEDLIERIYKKLFWEPEFSKHKFSYVYAFFNIGIRPQEDIIQEAYKEFLEKLDNFSVKKLYEITHIKPSEDIVHEAYKESLKKLDIYFVKKLYETTKIEIPNKLERLVHKTYEGLLKKIPESIYTSDVVDDILNLYSITHIKPSEKQIENMCNYLLKKLDIHSLKKLCETIKIEIPNKLEGLVHKTYEELLKKVPESIYTSFIVDNILNLYSITHIKPSEDIVHEAYKESLKKLDIYFVKKLYETTKIEIPNKLERLVHKTYKELLKKIPESIYTSGIVDDILNLYSITHVKPSEELVENMCNYLLKEGYTYSANRLNQIFNNISFSKNF